MKLSVNILCQFCDKHPESIIIIRTALVRLNSAAVIYKLQIQMAFETGLPFTSCGTLSKLLNLFVHQVSYLWNEVNNVPTWKDCYVD